jgi:N-acetylneuraminic acid mutarotase
MEASFKRRALRINTVSKDSRGMWEEAKVIAPLPPRRCNHSANIIDNKLIVYGGQDITEGVLSDLWIFNINPLNTIEEKWTKIDEENLPGPLCRHSSVVYQQKIFLLGGTDLNSEKGEMFSYDPFRNSWDASIGMHKAIDSHSAVVYKNLMIVFGGYLQGKLSNSTFVFDFQERIWDVLQVAGQIPEERADHSAVVHKDFMYTYGGLVNSSEYSSEVWRLNLLEPSWSCIQFSGDSPGSVSGHSACVFSDVMLVFGGVRDILKETNEMYAFEFETASWLLIQTETESKDPVIDREDGRTKNYTDVKKKTKNDHFATHRDKSRDKCKNSLKVAHDSYETQKPIKAGPAVFRGRIKGKIPHSRDGHTGVIFEDFMIIFGGDRHKMPFNDLYFYSINENLLKKH